MLHFCYTAFIYRFAYNVRFLPVIVEQCRIRRYCHDEEYGHEGYATTVIPALDVDPQEHEGRAYGNHQYNRSYQCVRVHEILIQQNIGKVNSCAEKIDIRIRDLQTRIFHIKKNRSKKI